MNSVKCKTVQSPFPGLQKQALPVSVSPVLTLYTTIMDKILNSRAFFQFKMPKPTSTPKQRWKLASGEGGGGKGELRAIFEQDALFYESTQKLEKIINTALLFQGILPRIVGKTVQQHQTFSLPSSLSWSSTSSS